MPKNEFKEIRKTIDAEFATDRYQRVKFFKKMRNKIDVLYRNHSDEIRKTREGLAFETKETRYLVGESLYRTTEIHRLMMEIEKTSLLTLCISLATLIIVAGMLLAW
jgi:hypothetical protein